MSAAPPLRVGWCPGALRPMQSGDGLILRIKPRCATLTLDQARRIAEVSRRFGNGAIDLTSHANLQIRGVTDATLPPALDGLDEAGLVDRDPLGEAVRNVVVSPLAGLDATARLDIRPLVAALERLLTEDPVLRRLPGKVFFSVDDGGTPGLGDLSADVAFRAIPHAGGVAFSVVIGRDGEGVCKPDAVVEVAGRLGSLLVAAAEADPEIRRMRHLVRRDGAGRVLGAAGLGSVLPSPLGGEGIHPFSSRRSPMPSSRGAKRRGDPAKPLGQSGLLRSARNDGMEKRQGESSRLLEEKGEPRSAGTVMAETAVLRVAAPFGRLSAAQLHALIDAVARAGGSELRMTPWRAMLVPGVIDVIDFNMMEHDVVRKPVPTFRHHALARACERAGLVVDPADPRLRVAACPGTPGCRRGSTPVLDDATRLAPRRAPGVGIALHVSGCGKGCAHPGVAPVTLVARDGRYDVVLEGPVSGVPVATGLTIEAVEAWLADRAGSETRA